LVPWDGDTHAMNREDDAQEAVDEAEARSGLARADSAERLDDAADTAIAWCGAVSGTAGAVLERVMMAVKVGSSCRLSISTKGGVHRHVLRRRLSTGSGIKLAIGHLIPFRGLPLESHVA
jgi:hypothetical protein